MRHLHTILCAGAATPLVALLTSGCGSEAAKTASAQQQAANALTGSKPRQVASRVETTAAIKQVITAIETCGVQLPEGGYASDTIDCSSASTLVGVDPTLAKLGIIPNAPTSMTQTQVQLTPDRQGFVVQRLAKDAAGGAYFAEMHSSTGDIRRYCGASPYQAGATATAALEGSSLCPGGTW